MENLLTAKEVQELLRLDRTTIYRMLKDGRLTGVKVGQQWRFDQSEVDELLAGAAQESEELSASECSLPLHCVQTVQDVFAEIGEIGSVTIDTHGQPLTRISNCSEFCQLMINSPKGYRACVESWQQLGKQDTPEGEFFTCHAGLNYNGAGIRVGGEKLASLIAGQFYCDSADPVEQAERVERLSTRYDIDAVKLTETIKRIPVIDNRKKTQLQQWLKQVARTFEEITSERTSLMNRLKKIAAMSAVESQTLYGGTNV